MGGSVSALEQAHVTHSRAQQRAQPAPWLPPCEGTGVCTQRRVLQSCTACHVITRPLTPAPAERLRLPGRQDGGRQGELFCPVCALCGGWREPPPGGASRAAAALASVFAALSLACLALHCRTSASQRARVARVASGRRACPPAGGEGSRGAAARAGLLSATHRLGQLAFVAAALLSRCFGVPSGPERWSGPGRAGARRDLPAVP